MATMIRVAHVVYSYLPVTQNWIYSQLRFNRSCDQSVVSLKSEQTLQFPWDRRFTAFEPSSPLSFVRLMLARYWIVQPRRFFRSALEAIRPDLVHGHFSTESWRILPEVRRARLPLVTTFYGLDVDKLPRRRFWKRRYKRLFSEGNRFLVEGPFMEKRLCALGCPEDKTVVSPLGVDLDLYRADSAQRSTPVSGEGDLRVLFVGLQREKKGPLDAAEVFCRAAANDPRLTFHCIGEGRYRAAMEHRFRCANLLHRVTFHGSVSFGVYRYLLIQSHIVLVPSHYAADGDCEGGAPVVSIEAQAAGKPVVGTRHCDIPFVIEHGKGGLLSAEHDVESMTRDLLCLAQDITTRLRMGEEGRRHAMRQHDIRLRAKTMAALYSSIVAEARKGSANG